jgi:hypothetical protein
MIESFAINVGKHQNPFPIDCNDGGFCKKTGNKIPALKHFKLEI